MTASSAPIVRRQGRGIAVAAIVILGIARLTIAQETHAPGSSFRDCAGVCPEMVVMPQGSFLMGSPASEIGHEAAMEDPQHRVTIGYDFAMGKFEVTRDEFGAFARATQLPDPPGCNVHQPPHWPTIKGLSWHSPGFEQTGRDPAICVSWKDAQAYVEWLTMKTGYPYRLPSESEWEYAARAGTETADYWGDSQSEACAYANGADLTMQEHFPDQVAAQPCHDGFVYTAPVGSFKPNAFGLYDMMGNVFEMLTDCYERTYQDAPADGSPKVTAACACRSNRGGSWTSTPTGLRAAYRDCDKEDTRVVDLGFRVARRL